MTHFQTLEELPGQFRKIPLLVAAVWCFSAVFLPVARADTGSSKSTKRHSISLPTSVTGAELVAYGEIDADPSIAQQDEPQTVMGHVNVMHELETPRFKQGESVIQAKIGTRFGLSVQMVGSPDEAVVYEVSTRVTHPPMTNPASKETSTQSEWESPMNIGYARFAGWQFEEPWELVGGDWKIEILYKGKVLVSKDFKVEIEEV